MIRKIEIMKGETSSTAMSQHVKLVLRLMIHGLMVGTVGSIHQRSCITNLNGGADPLLDAAANNLEQCG
jgi:hypothetical protein